MPEDSQSILTAFADAYRSIRRAPLLSWVALVVGTVGLLLAAANAAPAPQSPPQGWPGWAQALPWWQLVREVSIAAVVSFFLSLFLDEPLRDQTVRKLGRDVAPFLIAALTVPEMRFKMRQICEFGIIRRDSKVHIWIEKIDPAGTKYRIKVQVRSKFCNISNTEQPLTARIAVDEETNGQLIGLFLRPENLQGLSNQQWSSLSSPQPAPIDGQLVVEIPVSFPNCGDRPECYLEATGEYCEDVTMIGKVGKTLIESYWPLMGMEIECMDRPADIELKVKIPYHPDLKQIGSSDRWISSVAILPGERVDLILIRNVHAQAATQTVLVTQQPPPGTATTTGAAQQAAPAQNQKPPTPAQ